MTLPTAIVLGVDTPIGLAIVRDLGRHGVPVKGIARSEAGIGLYSKYVSARALRPAGDDALAALIRGMAGDEPAFVLTVSEADIVWLQRHAEDIAPAVPLVPDPDAFAQVIDKARTLEAAKTVGIETPRSWQPESHVDVDRIAGETSWPVVLKWADAGAVADDLAAHGLPFEKTRYCHDAAGLKSALARYEPLGRYPLVQTYVPGHGLGQFIFVHQGRPLLTFQHRRLHDWPPEGGTSTVCAAVPPGAHAELMDKSVALLNALGWEGAAMVEYRYDPKTDQAVLMEVNGRFWGSLPLAIHCGATFPWLTYTVQGLGNVPEAPASRHDLHARYMVPETRRLLRVLFRPGAIPDPAFRRTPLRDLAGYVLGFFDARGRYYVWSWDDPKPFFADLWFMLKKALGLGR